MLVEDDIVDVMTVKRALRDTNVTNPLIVAETFYYLPEWVRKTTESTEDTEKIATLCALRALCGYLLRHNQSPPGKIKKSLVASDDEEAFTYLMDGGNKRPEIVLLDLNIPKMNGIEFLKAAKRNGVLKSIPVIVLTTSREDKDTVDSFDLGVSGYMVKPVGYAQFVEVMKTINLYWTLSELPEG